MAYIELRRFLHTTFREKALGALSYLNGMGCMAGILAGAGGAQLWGLTGPWAAAWTLLWIAVGFYLTSERHGVLIATRLRARLAYWRRLLLAQTTVDGLRLNASSETNGAPEPQIGVVLQDGTILYEPVRGDP